MRQKKKVIAALLITLLTFISFFYLQKTHFFQLLELKTIDQRFQLAQKNLKAHDDVVLVMLDESSLQTLKSILGRWPWPRAIYRDIIDFFSAAGAKAILFDILFTEPQIPRDEDGELGEDDQALLMSSYESEITHHAYQLLQDHEDEYNKTLLDQPLPQDFIDLFAWGDTPENFPKQNNNLYYLPFEELYQFSYSMGIVEFQPDDDGIYRSTHLLREYQGKLYPPLSLSAFSDELKDEEIIQDSQSLTIGNRQIPLHFEGRYLINMKKEFQNYSLGGVLASIQQINKGNLDNLIVDPDDFHDKIILIGASAVGIEDLKNTSIGRSVPGVYLHASIISNLIENDFIQKKDHLSYYLILALLLTLLTFTLIFSSRQLFSFILYLIITTGYLYHAFVQFDEYRYLYPVAAPFLMFITALLLSYVFRSMTEGKEKKFLKEVFGNYISPELIEVMYENEQTPQLGGDSAVRSAFFTDIVSFSTFSEKLSPSDLVELLNQYLSEMTEILIANKGTLDKYVGDAIIAFFGAPLPLEDHAYKACLTAIRMQEALKNLRKNWQEQQDRWPSIVHHMSMRIGINTDEMVTGNMGSSMRMNYTMMGDGVNLAARLESSAKYYGVYNQISESTRQQAGEEFLYRELDLVQVMGRSQPVRTYELITLKKDASSEQVQLVEIFESALAQYKKQNFSQALKIFQESQPLESSRYPDLTTATSASQVYIERCQHFLSTPPPPDWDGVFKMTSK